MNIFSAIRVPIFSPNTTTDRDTLLCEFFQEKLQRQSELWMRGGGASMIPLFARSARLRIRLCQGKPQVGQVVVVVRNNRLVAHRVVSIDETWGKLITKGDSLHWFDYPVDLPTMVGRVDMVYFFGRQKKRVDDFELARLSRRLGQWFEGRYEHWPQFFKHLLYIGAYSVGLFYLTLTRLARLLL